MVPGTCKVEKRKGKNKNCREGEQTPCEAKKKNGGREARQAQKRPTLQAWKNFLMNPLEREGKKGRADNKPRERRGP